MCDGIGGLYSCDTGKHKYIIVTSSFAFPKSLFISSCSSVKKAGMILTLACRLAKFSNASLAFSLNCCACLVCSWAALNACIFSSFSLNLNFIYSIWNFLPSSKHWFSSSSNSFLDTPRLMWSPGAQTWGREPFS